MIYIIQLAFWNEAQFTISPTLMKREHFLMFSLTLDFLCIFKSCQSDRKRITSHFCLSYISFLVNLNIFFINVFFILCTLLMILLSFSHWFIVIYMFRKIITWLISMLWVISSGFYLSINLIICVVVAAVLAHIFVLFCFYYYILLFQ